MLSWRAWLLAITSALVASCDSTDLDAERVSAGTRAGPVLQVVQHDSVWEVEPRLSPESLAFALATMPDVRRDRLTATVARAVSGLEASTNPFIVDLDEAPLEERRSDLQRDLLPAWSAAAALLAAEWTSADGRLSVRGLGRCPAEAVRCIRAWDAPQNGPRADRSARMAAWPMTAATVLDLPSARTAAEVGARLRATAHEVEGIALVVSPDAEPAPAEVVSDLERLLVSVGLVQSREQIPRAVPSAPEWVDDSHVLVVPRFGHLARLGELSGDLERLSEKLRLPPEAVLLSSGCGFQPARRPCGPRSGPPARGSLE